MTKHAVFAGLALVMLSASGLLLLVPSEAREIRLAQPLHLVPTTIGNWRTVDAATDVLAPDLRAPARLSRTYRQGGHTVWIDVAFYPFQSDGDRLAAHELVLPGRGWTELTVRPIRIALDAGSKDSMSANLGLMRTSNRRIATVYWYQVGRHSLASDTAYRALLLYNRLMHQRSDAAFVRVASVVPDGADLETMMAKDIDFIQRFYRTILQYLPA